MDEWFAFYHHLKDQWWAYYYPPNGSTGPYPEGTFIDFPEEGLAYGEGILMVKENEIDEALISLAHYPEIVDDPRNIFVVKLVFYKMLERPIRVVYAPDFTRSYPMVEFI